MREPLRWPIGFDVGVGVIGATCAGCKRSAGGLFANLYSGALVHRNLAIIAELATVLHLLPTDDNTSGIVANSYLTVAGRVWATPEFWMQSGLGLNIFSSIVTGPDTHELAPGFTLAIGGELAQQPNFGIDLAVRAGADLYLDAYIIGITVGWHWY